MKNSRKKNNLMHYHSDLQSYFLFNPFKETNFIDWIYRFLSVKDNFLRFLNEFNDYLYYHLRYLSYGLYICDFHSISRSKEFSHIITRRLEQKETCDLLFVLSTLLHPYYQKNLCKRILWISNSYFEIYFTSCTFAYHTVDILK